MIIRGLPTGLPADSPQTIQAQATITTGVPITGHPTPVHHTAAAAGAAQVMADQADHTRAAAGHQGAIPDRVVHILQDPADPGHLQAVLRAVLRAVHPEVQDGAVTRGAAEGVIKKIFPGFPPITLRS